jgi:RNA polymerase-binding transcription factor DksA
MNLDAARKRLTEERSRLERVRAGSISQQSGEASEWKATGELSLVDLHPADVGTETFERDKAMSIRYNVEAEIADVERALRRLDEGTYGRCEACGRPIGAARLHARPMTRFCIEDQANAERHARSA